MDTLKRKKINPSSLLIKLICKYLYSFIFGDRLCYSSTGLRSITKFKLAMTSWSSCPHLSIASTWDSTWALVHDGYYCTIEIYPQFVATIFKLYQKAKKKKRFDLPLWMKQHKAYLPSWNGSNGLSILGKIPESAVDYTSYRPKTWFLSNKYLQIEKGMTLG